MKRKRDAEIISALIGDPRNAEEKKARDLAIQIAEADELIRRRAAELIQTADLLDAPTPEADPTDIAFMKTGISARLAEAANAPKLKRPIFGPILSFASALGLVLLSISIVHTFYRAYSVEGPAETVAVEDQTADEYDDYYSIYPALASLSEDEAESLIEELPTVFEEIESENAEVFDHAYGDQYYDDLAELSETELALLLEGLG